MLIPTTAGSSSTTLAALVVVCTVGVFVWWNLSGRVTNLEEHVALIEGRGVSFWRPASSLPDKSGKDADQPRVTAVKYTQVLKPAGCSVNPAVAYESTGELPPECEPERKSMSAISAWPTHAYVINLPEKIQAFHDRRDYLESFGIKLQRWPAVNGSAVFKASEYETIPDGTAANKTTRRWYDASRKKWAHEDKDDGFLTLGERGYLASMKKLFESALTDPEAKTILVIDEDAIFDCDFRARLLDVLSSPRCGGHIHHNASRGGLLVLGTSIWIETWGNGQTLKGWALTNADLRARREAGDDKPKCFNAHSKSFGSYAALYHRDTFQAILDWIKNNREPFDHIYPYLSELGHPVRIAYPFIAIQDVRHKSTIDNRGPLQDNLAMRARLHHWQLDRYCNPDFTPMLGALRAAN